MNVLNNYYEILDLKYLKKIELLERENLLFKKIIGKTVKDINDSNNLCSCRICYNFIKIKDLLVIEKCNHYYCINCIKIYLEFEINNGHVDIKCPHPSCYNNFIFCQISKIVSDSLLKRYDLILLRNCVINSDDMMYCPKKGCGYICIKNNCSNYVDCLFCYNQFCFLCTDIYKGKHICSKKKLLSLIPKDIVEIYGKKDIKICPQCKCVVFKERGCNSVTCLFCKTKFCWNCLTKKSDFKSHKCSNYYDNESEDETISDSESNSDNESDSESETNSYSESETDSDSSWL